METEVKTRIYFHGVAESLKKLGDTIVHNGRFPVGNRIDFSCVEDLVPVLHNRDLYKPKESTSDGYCATDPSPEQTEQFKSLRETHVNANGFIGFRDDYINLDHDYVFSIYGSDSLTVGANFKDYSPNLFFIKMAKDYGVHVSIVEFVLLDGTYLTYINSEGDAVRLANNANTIIANPEFRNSALQLKLLKPSDIVALAIFLGSESIAHEVMDSYPVSLNDMRESFFAMNNYINNANSRSLDYNRASPFNGLSRSTNHFETSVITKRFNEVYNDWQTKKESDKNSKEESDKKSTGM